MAARDSRPSARQRHIQELIQLAIDHSELADGEWQKKYSFPKPRWLRDAVLAYELSGERMDRANRRLMRRELQGAPWKRRKA